MNACAQHFDFVVVGGGLAGSECAFQLAEAGAKVALVEMRPKKKSAAHQGEGLAELVCSNSFRSANPENAVGLLKEEMRALGSLILRAGELARVPAGDAFAVDRDLFSQAVTRALSAHPRIAIFADEISAFEPCADGIVALGSAASYRGCRAICATGPLSSPPLHGFLETLFSKRALYFFDSIAPIVATDSIDRSIVYALSRYGKGEGDEYLNCPFNKEEYDRFISNLLYADLLPLSELDRPIFFEACLPIEVMASRGPETLRFGPMKPVGLPDPRTGEEPYAVIQLRPENRDRTCYNLVGFQTRMKWGEQKRVFSEVPGLQKAEFLRYGAMHRNTYLKSPELLTDCLEAKTMPRLHFAGQMTGVEGYVESAAIGLLLGLLLPGLERRGEFSPPPPTTSRAASTVPSARCRSAWSRWDWPSAAS